MYAPLLVIVSLYGVTTINGLCPRNVCLSMKISFGFESNCTLLKWSDLKECMEKKMNISNNYIEDINIDSDSTFDTIVQLSLSNNKLKKLPELFLYNAVVLEELNMAYNMLESLPQEFLKNSSLLKLLNLEGNSLSSMPSSIFKPNFTMTVDCNCDIVSSIMTQMPEQCKNVTDCSYNLKCLKDSNWYNVDDFYQTECKLKYLLLYILTPIIVLVLIVVGGAIIYCYHKKKRADFDRKSISDKSPTHSQPRYTTRNVNNVAPSSKEFREPGQDYENVIVGYKHTNQAKPYDYLESPNGQGANSNTMTEEDIYLESDVNDQPIYNNTHDLYYSYNEHDPRNNEEDDVYIIPNQ